MFGVTTRVVLRSPPAPATFGHWVSSPPRTHDIAETYGYVERRLSSTVGLHLSFALGEDGRPDMQISTPATDGATVLGR
jgi:hypothetical protein